MLGKKISLWTLPLFLLTVGCTEDVPSFSVLAENSQFVQNNPEARYTKIDILWVIDNSGSMQTSQDNLKNNFESFISKFNAKGYDYQMAVTTTEAYEYAYGVTDYYHSTPDEFAVFKDGITDLFNNIHTGINIVTPETPDGENVFLTNVYQGVRGSGKERPFQSMEAALTHPTNAGFIREGSFLAVIMLSDEDDFSHPTYGWDPDYTETNLAPYYNDANIFSIDRYVDLLGDLTDSSGEAKRFSVNAIGIWDSACWSAQGGSGRKIGVRMGELVDATGGMRGDICGDFATDLANISEEILKLSTQFYLDRTPDAATIVIKIDDELVPNISSNPGPKSGGWEYNESANSILFSGDYIPSQGAIIDVQFETLTLEN